jgi:hypothetical protein
MPPVGYTGKHRERSGRRSTKSGVLQRSLAYCGVDGSLGRQHRRGRNRNSGATICLCCAAPNLVQTVIPSRRVRPTLSCLPPLPFVWAELSPDSRATGATSQGATACATTAGRARNVARDDASAAVRQHEFGAAWSVAYSAIELVQSSIAGRAIASVPAPNARA